jgi:hypothetical protein
MGMSIVEVQNQENGDGERRLLWKLNRANRRIDRARCIQFTFSNPNSISFILMLSVSTFMSFKRSRPSACPPTQNHVRNFELPYVSPMLLSTTSLCCCHPKSVWHRSPVALRSKEYVWRRLIAGILGLNPTECVYVRLLCLLCVVQVAASAMGWSLLQSNATGCACLILCDLETLTKRRPRPELDCCATEGHNIWQTLWVTGFLIK